MNSPSPAGGDGGRFNPLSFSSTRSSTKFRRGATANTSGATLLPYGTVTVATAILLAYHAVMVPSPLPVTLTWPVASSTVATVVSADVYFTQRVTSRVEPSL